MSPTDVLQIIVAVVVGLFIYSKWPSKKISAPMNPVLKKQAGILGLIVAINVVVFAWLLVHVLQNTPDPGLIILFSPIVFVAVALVIAAAPMLGILAFRNLGASENRSQLLRKSMFWFLPLVMIDLMILIF